MDVAARSETQTLILNAIHHGRVSLWERVQQRLLQVLRSTRPSALENNIQEVESIFSRSSALIAIGELFSGIDADLLQPVVSEKCMQYFSSLHVQTCERLVLALDSDSWRKLPLPDSFDFHDIKELKTEYALALDSFRLSSTTPQASVLFATFADGGDPFSIVPVPIWSPLNTPVSFSAPPPAPTPQLIVTSSALFVLQSVGKYLAVMRTLPILRQAAWKAIQDLFDVYLIAVMSLFLAEYPRFVEGQPSYPATARRYPRMCAIINAALSSMRDRRFAYGGVRIAPATAASGAPRFLKPTQIGLDQIDDLYAVAVRRTALESLKRIAAVFDYLKPVLERYITPADAVTETCALLSSIVSDLEEAQYWFLASRLMNDQVKPLVQLIGNCKWDVAELKEAANPYVDKLVDTFRTFRARLEVLKKADDIDDALMQRLSTSMMRIVMDSLVDAFSAVKRCSTEGRAAMSLDVSVLQRGLKDVFGTWPIPGSARVDDYIKAYYLPAKDLLDWIAAHTQEFTLDHHLGLARVSSAVTSMKPKEMSEFLDHVTKMYNDGRNR